MAPSPRPSTLPNSATKVLASSYGGGLVDGGGLALSGRHALLDDNARSRAVLSQLVLEAAWHPWYPTAGSGLGDQVQGNLEADLEDPFQVTLGSFWHSLLSIWRLGHHLGLLRCLSRHDLMWLLAQGNAARGQ